MRLTNLQLKVLLPSRVFAEKSQVLRMVVESSQGTVGILPNRRDCVMALVPGILVYETAEAGEGYLALDEGVLVKAGGCVQIAVRNAIGGMALDQLQQAVEQEFLQLDEQEKAMRTILGKLEGSFMHRFSSLHHV